jgi:hypothetical protein
MYYSCGQHQQEPPQTGEEFVFDHRVGQAILHLGKHRHAARPITSGHRFNLILWVRRHCSPLSSLPALMPAYVVMVSYIVSLIRIS